MSNVTTLDLRPANSNAAALPANYEAEQAVLGCILYDNDAMLACEGLEPTHFREAAHGRLFELCRDYIGKGRLAERITLMAALASDAALAELGGEQYLGDLVDHAPPVRHVRDYAEAIIETALRRDMISVADEMKASAHEGGLPARETLHLAEAALMGLSVPQARTRLVTAREAAASVLAYLDAPDVTGGVLTGLAPLDEHLGSLLPDDLILIAGRPGMGKSALAACIALNVARTGVGVIEINSEMNTDQMMRRHLTDLAFERWGPDAPTYKDLRRRRFTAGQREMLERVAEQVSALPLVSVKRTGLTLSSLRSLVRRQRAAWAAQGIELGLITVDHVGLLAADGGGKDRYTDQTNIAIGMKQLADELKIPVIALVQLSRKVEDRDSKRPMLSDLRDSGAWEENADTVIGAFREAYYANKEPEPKDDGRSNSMLRWQEWDRKRKSKVIDAILLKVREGEEGIVSLWASIGHNAIRAADPNSGGFL